MRLGSLKSTPDPRSPTVGTSQPEGLCGRTGPLPGLSSDPEGRGPYVGVVWSKRTPVGDGPWTASVGETDRGEWEQGQ